MNREKLTLLRNQIPISLSQAIKLLREHDGDITACENYFYARNIEEISQVTGCDKDTAKKYYETYSYDTAKAISKIKKLLDRRSVLITTRKSKVIRNEIGFSLWPETASGECYKIGEKNNIFIPIDDFEYIISAFYIGFPQKNQKRFDMCGYNYFDRVIGQQIAEKISEIETNSPIIKKFLREVKNWLFEKLEYSDIIVVCGNL